LFSFITRATCDPATGDFGDATVIRNATFRTT
jgi:hypothetical protein